MKLLADTCVSRYAVVVWARAGHDVLWAGELDRDPGDEELLKRAFIEARVVITLDRDFGTLAVLHALPHCGIIRLVGFRAGEQGAAGLEAAARYEAELAQGALVTVERARTSVRSREN